MSRTQDHIATRRIKSTKSPNDITGRRTHDLPTCSAMPRPNAQPRTPNLALLKKKNGGTTNIRHQCTKFTRLDDLGARDLSAACLEDEIKLDFTYARIKGRYCIKQTRHPHKNFIIRHAARSLNSTTYSIIGVRSRDISVRTATRQRTRQPRNRGSIHGRSNRFSLLHSAMPSPAQGQTEPPIP
jgi:hypothetical protein